MNHTDVLNLLIGGIGSLSLLILTQIAGQLKQLSSTMNLLSVQMAVVIERVDSHENRITKIEGDQK